MKVGAMDLRRLTRAELPCETVALARFLIGKILVRLLPPGQVGGRIVETEDYIQTDAAAESTSPAKIGVSTRIGLTKAAHRPLRFYLKGSVYVSGPTLLNR